MIVIIILRIPFYLKRRICIIRVSSGYVLNPIRKGGIVMIFTPDLNKDLRGITTPALDLDPLFAPKQSGYLGADAVLSIPLTDGRVLWCFGDTLIGRREKGKRILEAMPHNTIAIQSPGPVGPENVEWILTDNKGRLADFFSLPPREKDKWIWPATGICLDGEVFIFGNVVTHEKGSCDALSFRVVGSRLFRIADTSGHPIDWKMESTPVEHPFERILFSSACLLEPPFLYILGVEFFTGRLPIRNTYTVLARVNMDDLRREKKSPRFEYYCGEVESCEWRSGGGRIFPLYQPGVAESTLYYDAPRKRYLATTYYPGKPDYHIVTAPALTGPWSWPTLIFREEKSRPVNAYLFYAFRMHPHLAAHEDEMILTYIVNARSVSDLLVDCERYYPRFLRIDLSRL